jgi:hypothetical protein
MTSVSSHVGLKSSAYHHYHLQGRPSWPVPFQRSSSQRRLGLPRVRHLVAVGGLSTPSHLDGRSREAFPRDCLLGDLRRMKLRVNLEGQLRI